MSGKLPPKKIARRSGSRFGLGLALELGLGELFLGDNFRRTIYLLGTQQQLTHPPVNSSTLPLRKIPVFQGVPPRHTVFTLSCITPLWESATAHSPSGKELYHSSQEDTRFAAGRCTSGYNFYFILRHPSLGLNNILLTLQ